MALIRKTFIYSLKNVSFVLTMVHLLISLKLYENGVMFNSNLLQPLNFNILLLCYFILFAFFGFSVGIKTGRYLYRHWIRYRINYLLTKNYQKFGNQPLFTDEELLVWLKNAIISKFTKKGESLPENYFFDCEAEIDQKYFEVGESEEDQEWLSWFPTLKDIVLYQVNQGKIQYIRPNTSLMGGKQPETIPFRRLEHIFIHQRYQCIIPIEDLEFFIKENGFKIDKDFKIHWQLLIGEKLLKNGFFLDKNSVKSYKKW